MYQPAHHALHVAGMASVAFSMPVFAEIQANTLSQIEVSGGKQAEVAEQSTTLWRTSIYYA